MKVRGLSILILFINTTKTLRKEKLFGKHQGVGGADPHIELTKL